MSCNLRFENDHQKSFRSYTSNNLRNNASNHITNKSFVQIINTRSQQSTVFETLWQIINIHTIHSTLFIHSYTWHISWKGGCEFDKTTKQDCEKLCYESHFNRSRSALCESFQQCCTSNKKFFDQYSVQLRWRGVWVGNIGNYYA